MAPSIEVRPWGRKDRSALASWPAHDLPDHWLAGVGLEGPRESWAICVDGELGGRITIRQRRLIIRGWLPVDSARMGIYLRPGTYGQGIGTAALQHFTQHIAFAQEGIDLLRVDVAHDNTRAIRCYEKSGFERLREIGGLVEMEKDCAPC